MIPASTCPWLASSSTREYSTRLWPLTVPMSWAKVSWLLGSFLFLSLLTCCSVNYWRLLTNFFRICSINNKHKCTAMDLSLYLGVNGRRRIIMVITLLATAMKSSTHTASWSWCFAWPIACPACSTVYLWHGWAIFLQQGVNVTLVTTLTKIVVATITSWSWFNAWQICHRPALSNNSAWRRSHVRLLFQRCEDIPLSADFAFLCGDNGQFIVKGMSINSLSSYPASDASNCGR